MVQQILHVAPPLGWPLWLCLATLAACGDGKGVGAAPPTASAAPRLAPPAAAAQEGRDRDRLRDDSRLILERSCGQCHIGDYPTALSRALAVFDLSEIEWSARMSEAQLRDAERRLAGPLPPDGDPSDVTPEERALFGRFVDAEVVRRATGGARAH